MGAVIKTYVDKNDPMAKRTSWPYSCVGNRFWFIFPSGATSCNIWTDFLLHLSTIKDEVSKRDNIGLLAFPVVKES